LGAIGGRDVVVDDRERLLRRAHLALGHTQALEGLRRGHFMDQMAVDIEQAGAVTGFVDQMVVPDFVVQRGRFGHERELQEWLRSVWREARASKESVGASKRARKFRGR